jgi:predicted acylesterase/phospholipase RssA
VTKIAGTSAGAIVGSFFAAGISMQSVRENLLGESGKKLLSSFTKPNLFFMLIKTLLNLSVTPLWSDGELKKWLNNIFKNTDTIGKVKKARGIDIEIVSTNLRARTDFRKYQDMENIVDALLDSCGLPFLFRIWSRNPGPIYVDGGICENLPSSCLKNSDEHGNVIAISFEATTTDQPDGLLSFSAALLDAAISTSVRKSQDALGVNVYPIKTHIGTFDFKTALEHGLSDDHYTNTKTKAHEWFNEYLDRRRSNRAISLVAPWRSEDPTAISIMNAVSEIYNRQHSQSRFKYHKCQLIIDAFSLVKAGDPFHGSPDILQYTFVFETYDDPIYCIRFGISEDSNQANYVRDRINCNVYDSHGENVEITQIPAIENRSNRSRDICIFFDNPIKKDQGKYTIKFSEQAYNIIKTDAGGNSVNDDMIFLPTRAVGDISEVHFVLRLPTSFQNANMAGKPDSHVGRAMNQSDIITHNYHHTNNEFKTIGWIFKDFPAGTGECCGVDIKAIRV